MVGSSNLPPPTNHIRYLRVRFVRGTRVFTAFCYRFATKRGVEALDCVAICVLQHVSVDVDRHVDGRMPHERRDGFQIHASSQEMTPERVAEIVKADAPQVSAFERRSQAAADQIARALRVSFGRRKYEIKSPLPVSLKCPRTNELPTVSVTCSP